MAASSWRDRIAVHPKFEMMSRGELKVLGNDIKVNGPKHRPMYFVTRAGRHQLLDGRNRLAAMELAGLATDTEGNIVKEGEVDPFAYVISANIHRRHLTPEDRNRLVGELLKDNPQRSDRAIAKLTERSPTTVGRIRRELENTGDVSKLDTRTDTAGRQQPATKPARETPSDVEAQFEPEVIDPGVNDTDDVDHHPDEVGPQPDEEQPVTDTPEAPVDSAAVLNINSILNRHVDELKRHKRAIVQSDERGLIVHGRKYLKQLGGLSYSELAPTRQLSRPKRWQAAVQELQVIQSDYQDWFENLLENLPPAIKPIS
jgi:hypothetical protein